MTQPSPQIRTTPLEVGPLVRRAWSLCEQNYLFLLGMSLLILIAVSFIPVVLQGPTVVGLMYCFLAIERGESVGMETFGKGFDRFVDGLLAALLMMLISFVSVIFMIPSGILIAIGAASENEVFIVLGAIVAVLLLTPVGALLQFMTNIAFALIVDHDVDGVEAVKLTCKAVKQNLGAFLKIGLVTIGLSIVGMLLCGVGLLLVTPLVYALAWVAQKELFTPTEPIAEDVGDYSG